MLLPLSHNPFIVHNPVLSMQVLVSRFRIRAASLSLRAIVATKKVLPVLGVVRIKVNLKCRTKEVVRKFLSLNLQSSILTKHNRVLCKLAVRYMLYPINTSAALSRRQSTSMCHNHWKKFKHGSRSNGHLLHLLNRTLCSCLEQRSGQPTGLHMQ